MVGSSRAVRAAGADGDRGIVLCNEWDGTLRDEERGGDGGEEDAKRKMDGLSVTTGMEPPHDWDLGIRKHDGTVCR